MHHAQRAFTLLELAAVALILAVAAAVAVPALGNILAEAQLRTAADTLADDLATARRAALTRGGGILICASRDQIHCSHAARWDQGWIIRDESKVLLAHGALSARLASTASEGRHTISFDDAGRSPGSNTTITFCVRKRPARAVSVVNSGAGRIRQEPAETASAAACAHSRKNIR